MKKLVALVLALLSFSTLSAKPKVIATIFPAYDWARQIVGTNDAEVSMLISKGVDLHSYQPSVQDIAKISGADVFIYVGGESDGWVKGALKNARNKKMKVVNLMEIMGSRAKAEEVKEGMQAEDEHDHDHDEDDHDEDDHDEDDYDHDHADHDEEEELDEHVWLSLKNAQVLSSAICDALSDADKKNANSYRANYQALAKKLSALDEKYFSAVQAAKQKTLVFADRFPFRYLVDDYGLDYFAAFVGCSAETEASFKTVIFLANKADELGIKNLCVIENSDKKIAQTVNSSSKDKSRGILVLDSMQSTTGADVKKGATYLKVMESNLEVLKEALK